MGGSRESNGAGSLARRESGKSVKSRRGSGSVTPIRDLEIPPFRDPETRANSDGRTNGTSHLTEVADVEEAEKEEVTHKVNGNSSPKSPKQVLSSDCSESKEGK